MSRDADAAEAPPTLVYAIGRASQGVRQREIVLRGLVSVMRALSNGRGD